MALIQSSPWTDAANFGQGIGSALSQAFIQMPAIKAQIAQMLGQQQMQQQQFGLEKEKFGYEKERGAREYGLREQELGLQRETLGVTKQRAGIEEATSRSEMLKRQADIEKITSELAEQTRRRQVAQSMFQPTVTPQPGTPYTEPTPGTFGGQGGATPSAPMVTPAAGANYSPMEKVMMQELMMSDPAAAARMQMQKDFPWKAVGAHGMFDPTTGQIVGGQDPMAALYGPGMRFLGGFGAYDRPEFASQLEQVIRERFGLGGTNLQGGATSQGMVLTPEVIDALVREFGGDANAARQAAKDRGYIVR
jgi:hypothetical protein